MSEELEFAIKLAKDAGKILMQKINNAVIKKYKRDKRNIVTNADLKTEKIILGMIRRKYPKHKIYSEELGEDKKEEKNIWFIDSLDGTKYYVTGVNLFSVSIAFWRGDKPILGVVYMPASDDLYWAETGKGAYHNNKKIKVSSIRQMKEAIIYLDIAGINKFKKKEASIVLKKFNLIFKNSYRIRSFGWGSAGLCFIAQGAIDAYFDLSGKVKIYDLAAGIIVAEESGAKISGLDGNFHGQRVGHLVVTNGLLHKKFLKLLNS